MNVITKTRDAIKLARAKTATVLRTYSTRSIAANVLMVGFIIFTSIGAGLQSPALGFIAAGITCGILGFLLGLE